MNSELFPLSNVHREANLAIFTSSVEINPMKRSVNTSCYIAILLALCLPGIADGQVNQEPATNNAPVNLKKQEAVAKDKETAAPEAEGMAAMNEAGYFAMFTKLRKEALASNRYKIAPDKQKQLDQVVEKLKQLNARSFEYHYAKYLNSRYDTAAGSHLLEAYRIAPQRTEILDDLTSFYELTGDDNQQKKYCRLIQQKNIYDPYLYHYGKNLLKSLAGNAFLVTQGEWDTQPLWVLQQVQNVRTDVTVLQLDLLHREHYFNRMMAPLKLKKGAWKRFVADKAAFFRELAEIKSDKPVYLSLTVNQTLLGSTGNYLFNTGLAMRLSSTPVDNIPLLAENWKTFDLTHLQPETTDPEINKLAGNYIFPLGLLYQRAVSEGNQEEADKLKQLMTQIAKKAGKSKEMEEYFKKPPPK